MSRSNNVNSIAESGKYALPQLKLKTQLPIYNQFCPCDEVSRRLGLRGYGNYYFHWAQDVHGNPVVMKEDSSDGDGGTLTFAYADWDSEQQAFIPQQDLLPDSEPLHEPVYSAPTMEEYQEQLRLRMPPAEYDEDPVVIVNPESPKRRRSFLESKPIATLTATTTPQLGQLNTSAYSSGALPSGEMQRNILLVYVMFKNSKDVDKRLSEPYLLNMFTKDQPGSLVHFFNANFNHKVKINVLNNKVYYVTVPVNGKNFSNGSFNEVSSYALLEVLKQGFDLGSLFNQKPNKKSRYPHKWMGDTAVVSSLYSTDQVSCVPVFIVHGQEVSMNGGSTTGYGSGASVWATAYTSSDLLPNPNEPYIVGVDWDGNPKRVKYDVDDSKLGKAGTELLDVEPFTDSTGAHTFTKIVKPTLKYSFTWKSAKAGAFFGTEPQTMGVIAHELGHCLFSFPDYYDTDAEGTKPGTYDSISGLGNWSTMCKQHVGTPNGAWPPLFDGYSLHLANPKFTVPITKSGDYTIEGSSRPHIIICKDNPDECFILQPRLLIGGASSYDGASATQWAAHSDGIFVGYTQSDGKVKATPVTDAPVCWHWIDESEGLGNFSNYDPEAGTNLKPGLLIYHTILKGYPLASDIYINGGPPSTKGFKTTESTATHYEDMRVIVMEAHGGTQHLILDHTGGKSNVSQTITIPDVGSAPVSLEAKFGYFNDGDKKDLFGELTQDKFGQSTDPSNAYYFKSGKAPFNITNIKVDSSGKCTYHIEFIGATADDPNWDALPDDPQRPPSLMAIELKGAESDPEPTPVGAISLSANPSSATLSWMIDTFATTTLTATNIEGTATYSATCRDADDNPVPISDLGVDIQKVSESKATVTITPTPVPKSKYIITFQVTDSGRTADNTATAEFTLNLQWKPAFESWDIVDEKFCVTDFQLTSMSPDATVDRPNHLISVETGNVGKVKLSFPLAWGRVSLWKVDIAEPSVFVNGYVSVTQANDTEFTLTIDATKLPVGLYADLGDFTKTLTGNELRGMHLLPEVESPVWGASYATSSWDSPLSSAMDGSARPVLSNIVPGFTLTGTQVAQHLVLGVAVQVTAPVRKFTLDKDSFLLYLKAKGSLTFDPVEWDVIVTLHNFQSSDPVTDGNYYTWTDIPNHSSVTQVTTGYVILTDAQTQNIAEWHTSYNMADHVGVHNHTLIFTDPNMEPPDNTVTSPNVEATVRFYPLTLSADQTNLDITLPATDSIVNLTALSGTGDHTKITFIASESWVTFTAINSDGKCQAIFNPTTEGTYTVAIKATDPLVLDYPGFYTEADEATVIITVNVKATPLTLTAIPSTLSARMGRTVSTILHASGLLGTTATFSSDGGSKVTISQATVPVVRISSPSSSSVTALVSSAPLIDPQLPAPIASYSDPIDEEVATESVVGVADTVADLCFDTEGVHTVQFTVKDNDSGRIVGTDVATTDVTANVTAVIPACARPRYWRFREGCIDLTKIPDKVIV